MVNCKLSLIFENIIQEEEEEEEKWNKTILNLNHHETDSLLIIIIVQRIVFNCKLTKSNGPYEFNGEKWI